MKLRTLKSSLATVPSGLRGVQPLAVQTVERKRGWAGVQDRERIRRRDCGLCQECKRQGVISIGAAVDHIEPLWKGGRDDDTNKELLCKSCHDAKSAREAAERAGA